jgi:hypothetical protein
LGVLDQHEQQELQRLIERVLEAAGARRSEEERNDDSNR